MNINSQHKNPIITSLLNLFLAGGGYIYIGQVTKGILVIIVTIFLLFFCGIGIILPIFTCVDGYKLTQRINNGQTITPWQFFWNQPSPEVKTTPTDIKLVMVLMILPWLLLFWGGFYIGGIVYSGGFDNPTPGNPSYVVYRELINKFDSFGDLSTGMTLSILKVNDKKGNVIMADSPSVIICPGDTIQMALTMRKNGHITHFGLTDPLSGKLLELSYPISKGSDVVKNSNLTFSIPEDAHPGPNLNILWQADMYIIKEMDTKKGDKTQTFTGNNTYIAWFELIKPFSVSDTLALPISTHETRNDWINAKILERSNSVLTPKLVRFFILALFMTAILIFSKRNFLILMSTFIFFLGVTFPIIVIFAYLNGLFMIGSLAISLVVVVITIKNIKQFHSDIFDRLSK